MRNARGEVAISSACGGRGGHPCSFNLDGGDIVRTVPDGEMAPPDQQEEVLVGVDDDRVEVRWYYYISPSRELNAALGRRHAGKIEGDRSAGGSIFDQNRLVTL